MPTSRSCAASLADALDGHPDLDLARAILERRGGLPRMSPSASALQELGIAEGDGGDERRAVEAMVTALAELGHDVSPADPDYGLVGAALIPRGMAGVDAWLRVLKHGGSDTMVITMETADATG